VSEIVLKLLILEANPLFCECVLFWLGVMTYSIVFAPQLEKTSLRLERGNPDPAGNPQRCSSPGKNI